MGRRLAAVLAVATVGGAIAGCGSNNAASSSNGASAAPGSATVGGTGTTVSVGGSPSSPSELAYKRQFAAELAAARRQSIAKCEQGYDATHPSAALKADYAALCKNSVNGKTKGARTAGGNICAQQAGAAASSPALKAALAAACHSGAQNNQAGVNSAEYQACVAVIRANVPPALQARALPTCKHLGG